MNLSFPLIVLGIAHIHLTLAVPSFGVTFLRDRRQSIPQGSDCVIDPCPAGSGNCCRPNAMKECFSACPTYDKACLLKEYCCGPTQTPEQCFEDIICQRPPPPGVCDDGPTSGSPSPAPSPQQTKPVSVSPSPAPTPANVYVAPPPPPPSFGVTNIPPSAVGDVNYPATAPQTTKKPKAPATGVGVVDLSNMNSGNSVSGSGNSGSSTPSPSWSNTGNAGNTGGNVWMNPISSPQNVVQPGTNTQSSTPSVSWPGSSGSGNSGSGTPYYYPGTGDTGNTGSNVWTNPISSPQNVYPGTNTLSGQQNYGSNPGFTSLYPSSGSTFVNGGGNSGQRNKNPWGTGTIVRAAVKKPQVQKDPGAVFASHQNTFLRGVTGALATPQGHTVPSKTSVSDLAGYLEKFPMAALKLGQTLEEGQFLQGGCGYTLRLQTDGNMVLYDRTNTAVWDTNSAGVGVGPYSLRMSNDGSAQLFDKRSRSRNAEPLWQASSKRGNVFVVLKDGNVVVANTLTEAILWATDTAFGCSEDGTKGLPQGFFQ